MSNNAALQTSFNLAGFRRGADPGASMGHSNMDTLSTGRIGGNF
jgi:hypothetical protein